VPYEFPEDFSERIYKRIEAIKIAPSESPEKFLKSLFHSLKGLRAKKKGVSIDVPYLVGLYHGQGGLCAYSGLKMTHVRGEGRVQTNISIDRIDSSKGYEPGNVVLCCFAVNLMKQSLSVGEFHALVRRIADHLDTKEQHD